MSSEVLHPVDILAEEFLARLRQGEPVSIEEYAVGHPDFADEIRDLFPAMEVLERGKPQDDPGSSFVLNPTIPAMLGDYRILREVGRGGMGVVYEAEQCSLGRRVAIKILTANITQDTKALLRFRREARCAARLHHTNIVPVYEISHDQGLHFYAMQFIHGHGLHEVIKQLALLRGAGGRNRASVAGSNGTAFAEHGPRTEPVHLTVTLAQQLLGAKHPSGVFSSPRSNGTAGRVTPKSTVANASDGVSAAYDHSVPEFARGSAESLPDVPQSDSASLASATADSYFDAVAGIGVQVAEALAYAHEQGVLHRDIKPANLMMDIDGMVWLTDFGLAKEDTSGLTKTGEILGTLKYMPPERFRGITDARGDVFSLGLALYEMLTLRSDGIHGQVSPSQLAGRQEPVRPPPRRIDPSIPKDLELIVLKAIAAEPADRYPSASAMASDLRCFRAQLPILAQRANWVTQTWLWCRRNRWLAGMTTAATVLLLVAGLGWAASHILRIERDQAVQARVAAQHAERTAQRAEESAMVREHLARATSLRMSGNSGSRRRALEEIRQGVARDANRSLTRELRDEAIAALATVDTHAVVVPWSKVIPVPKSLIDNPTTPSPQPSPPKTGERESEGSRIGSYAEGPLLADLEQSLANIVGRSETGQRIPYAFSSDYKVCAVWDDDARRLLITDLSRESFVLTLELDDATEMAAGSTELAFSPRGDLLAMASHPEGGRLIVLEVASGKRILDRAKHHGYDSSPDGQWLAIGHEEQYVDLVDRNDPTSTRRIATPWIPQCLAFDPTGDHLAIGYARRGPDVDVVQTATLQRIAQLNVGSPGACDLCWRANGRDLVVARGETGSADLWDIQQQRRVYQTPWNQGFVARCAADPRDDFFITSHWGGTLRLWEVHSGRAVVNVTREFHPEWSADGSIIGSRQTAEGLEMIYLDRREIFRSLQDWRRHDEYAFPSLAEFSTDGRIVAVRFGSGDRMSESSHLNGHLAFWDTATRRLLTTFDTKQAVALSFSHDGQTLSLLRSQSLLRLPLHSDDNDGIRIGPPDAQLDVSTRSSFATIPKEGEHFAWVDQGCVNIIKGRGLEPIRFALPANHGNCMMSPNGRWMVTGGWHAVHVTIWDTLGEHAPREIPLGSQTIVSFSPDSSQLITCRWDAYRFWQLETLENSVTIPRSDCAMPNTMAISVDGTLAALWLRPGGLDIVKLPSGESLFRLQRPWQSPPVLLAFSPDASLLLEGHMRGAENLIGVWDLSRLNRELAAVDLSLHELEMRDRSHPQTPVPSLRFVGCEDLENVPTYIGNMTESQARRRLEELEAEYRASPDAGRAANNLAWGLLNAPEPLRDLQRALELAESVMEQSPNSDHRNTLGAAYYRTGQIVRAVEVLEQNLLEAQDDHLPFDYYFLAMSYAAAGQLERAQYYLKLANYWRTLEQDSQPIVSTQLLPELQALQAEAEAVVRQAIVGAMQRNED